MSTIESASIDNGDVAPHRGDTRPAPGWLNEADLAAIASALAARRPDRRRVAAVLELVACDDRLKPIDGVLLSLILNTWLNWKTGVAFVGIDTIAETTNRDRSTIKRALRRLRLVGAIASSVRHHDNGANRSNLCTVPALLVASEPALAPLLASGVVPLAIARSNTIREGGTAAPDKGAPAHPRGGQRCPDYNQGFPNRPESPPSDSESTPRAGGDGMRSDPDRDDVITALRRDRDRVADYRSRIDRVELIEPPDRDRLTASAVWHSVRPDRFDAAVKQTATGRGFGPDPLPITDSVAFFWSVAVGSANRATKPVLEGPFPEIDELIAEKQEAVRQAEARMALGTLASPEQRATKAQLQAALRELRERSPDIGVAL